MVTAAIYEEPARGDVGRACRQAGCQRRAGHFSGLAGHGRPEGVLPHAGEFWIEKEGQSCRLPEPALDCRGVVRP